MSWRPAHGGDRPLDRQRASSRARECTTKRLARRPEIQAATLASQLPGGAYVSRFIVVVDEDINPYNLGEVVWAMGTRCDPDRDIDIIRNCWSSPLDPLVREGEPPFNSRAIVDATKPFAWKDRFPPSVEFDSDLRRRVTEKWGDLIRSLSGSQ